MCGTTMAGSPQQIPKGERKSSPAISNLDECLIRSQPFAQRAARNLLRMGLPLADD